MPDRGGLGLPVRFIGRFLLAAGLLLLAWTYLQSYYVALLASPVNWIFSAWGLPVEFALRGDTLALGLPAAGGHPHYFQLQGHDLSYLHLPAAVALLLAAPGWAVGARLAWCSGAAAALWATHVLSLFGGGYSAVGSYAASLPAGARMELLERCGGGLSIGLADSLGHFAGWWSVWGGPALILVLFVLAAPPSLLWKVSPGEPAPGGSQS